MLLNIVKILHKTFHEAFIHFTHRHYLLLLSRSALIFSTIILMAFRSAIERFSFSFFANTSMRWISNAPSISI